MGTDAWTSRRIGAVKSRSGCKTCKIRRVKCGEERPNCLRCSSTGRRCEYVESTRSPPMNPLSTLGPNHALSMSPNSGQRERRAFGYYYQHAASQLAAGLTVDFWTAVVPQICRSEPAVWDAIIAISAMFEYPDQCQDFTFLRDKYKQTHSLSQTQQDALTWYSRSVCNIHSQIKRGTADPFISLISCVLFICVETIQGRTEEALQLYTQGVRLVLDLQAQVDQGSVSATKAALLTDTIIPLFLRLDNSSLTVSGVQASEVFKLANSHMKEKLVSIKSARYAITMLAAEAQLFERDATLHLQAVGGEHNVSTKMLEIKRNLQTRLQTWYRAYTTLCQGFLTKSDPIKHEPALLVYHAAATIAVSGSLMHRETIYDDHLEDFATIVKHASFLLDMTTGPDGKQPPFSFEPGVGIPLFLAAMKCREPSLRREALNLLRRSPPIQGFFKCTPVALLAENLMRLEESYNVTLGDEIAQNVIKSTFVRQESPRVAPPPQNHQAMRPHTPLVPEEARISHYGVFRPADWLPPGIRMDDIAKFGRGPEQLFLEFTRNCFDATDNTWRPGRSQCVPLDP